MKIWLDDIREPHDETYVWCKTPYEFREVLDNPDVSIEEISFDHDLACIGDDGVEISGYTCVRWLEKRLRSDATMPIPFLWVHSMNPVGRANIEFVIQRIEKLTTI